MCCSVRKEPISNRLDGFGIIIANVTISFTAFDIHAIWTNNFSKQFLIEAYNLSIPAYPFFLCIC
jgi:hypothetical protein